MKLEVHFRDRLIGTVINNGVDIELEGDRRRLENLVQFYAREGFEGDELLQEMAKRLHGNTWARLVTE